MKNFEVLNVFPIGENTSVTIKGNGDGLKNNMTIKDSSGIAHKLISVAMSSVQSAKENSKTTTLLVKGKFDSKIISL